MPVPSSRTWLFTLLFVLIAPFAHGQSSYSFMGDEIQPGERSRFMIPVQSGTDSTHVPVLVMHGAFDGPTLGITAGVHGYEYPPILASQKLIHQVDPAQLHGTILLVPVANMAGFWGRSPYINPLDDKNLNRQFPGSADGTITAQIAHFITTEIISRADFFLDMHAGDAPEDLATYSAFYNNESMPSVSSEAKAMAQALGFNYIVRFNTDGKDYMRDGQPSLYCSAEAFKRGIPAMDIEAGRLGQPDELLSQKIVAGVQRLLVHLEMQKGGSAQSTSEAVIIENRHYVDAPGSGIFYPSVAVGDYVMEGMELGRITTVLGEEKDVIRAPHDGLVLLLIGTPPINKGETVGVIGEVK